MFIAEFRPNQESSGGDSLYKAVALPGFCRDQCDDKEDAVVLQEEIITRKSKLLLLLIIVNNLLESHS